MKSVLHAALFTSLLASLSALAHHPAEDIVDEEAGLMVDENVADTPHADPVFDDMGNQARQSTRHPAIAPGCRLRQSPGFSRGRCSPSHGFP